MREKERYKMSNEQERTKTLLVCVGCGGIFYHGLSRMATWCHRRGDTWVILVDPDKVEEKNVTRQWGADLPGLQIVGEYKVKVAQQVLLKLGITSGAFKRAVIDGDLYSLHPHGGDKRPHYERYTRIMVLSTPDNHRCRVDVHEGCMRLALETGLEVLEITAGNTAGNGYAYGCVHRVTSIGCQVDTPIPPLGRSVRVRGEWVIDWARQHFGEDEPLKEWRREMEKRGIYAQLVCDGDWTKRHHDIVEEARLERMHETAPARVKEIEEKCKKCEFRGIACTGSIPIEAKGCGYAKEWQELQQYLPASCGNMEEEVAGQTMTSNQLTSLCIWDLAEMMIVENMVGEVCWSNGTEEEGKKYTKIQANLRKRGELP